MILEKMRSVNSILLDSVNATGNKHAVETFRNQLGLLNTSTTQLEQLLNLMEAMQDKAITPKIMTAEIKTSLQNAVDSCGEKVYDHSLDASTVQALKNVVDLYRNAIFSVWKQSVRVIKRFDLSIWTSLHMMIPCMLRRDQSPGIMPPVPDWHLNGRMKRPSPFWIILSGPAQLPPSRQWPSSNR